MRVMCGAVLLGALLVGAVGGQPPSSKEKSSIDDPTSVGGKTLQQWKELITKGDASQRAQAIMTIMEFGNSAAKCVPDLIGRLNDPDVSPRARALLALRTIAIEERDVEKVVSAVAKRLVYAGPGGSLAETQAVIRYEATITLRRFIADGAPAIPNLITATQDKASWEIRHNSIALLWRIGVETSKDKPPDPRITEALLSSIQPKATFQEKLEAIQGLGAMGRPGNQALLKRVIDTLSICTNARVESNRPLTIWAYAGLVAMQDGTAADKSLNRLLQFLKHENLDMRIQAAVAVGALKGQAKKTVPALVAMLKDREPLGIQAGCAALALVGDKSDAVISPLIELLDHKDIGCASAAVASLVNLKQNTTRVMSKFDKMLEKKDLDIRLRYIIDEGIKELKKPAKK
jgi:HEAT repeat protein